MKSSALSYGINNCSKKGKRKYAHFYSLFHGYSCHLLLLGKYFSMYSTSIPSNSNKHRLKHVFLITVWNDLCAPAHKDCIKNHYKVYTSEKLHNKLFTYITHASQEALSKFGKIPKKFNVPLCSTSKVISSSKTFSVWFSTSIHNTEAKKV